MAKRRDPNQKEYNPLDDARGRLPIDADLVRDVVAGVLAPIVPAPAAPQPTAAGPAVISPPTPTPPLPIAPTVDVPKPVVLERLTKYNKFLTTPREKLELERLAARISGALGVTVRSSQLIRACLIHLLHAENEIVDNAGKRQSIKRPSNAEAVALAEFDYLLASILEDGFRAAGPIGRPGEESADEAAVGDYSR